MLKEIAKLTQREEAILSMRFGLNDGVMYTLEETAKEFGVTRERVRQIEARAKEKVIKFFNSENPFAKWTIDTIKKSEKYGHHTQQKTT